MPLIQVPINQLSFSTQPAQLGDPWRYIPANQEAGEKLLAACQPPGFHESGAPGNMLTKEMEKKNQHFCFTGETAYPPREQACAQIAITILKRGL